MTGLAYIVHMSGIVLQERETREIWSHMHRNVGLKSRSQMYQMCPNVVFWRVGSREYNYMHLKPPARRRVDSGSSPWELTTIGITGVGFQYPVMVLRCDARNFSSF